MKRFYLITIIAIVVTTSIASHLLAIGALGPTTPVRGLRSRMSELLHGLRKWVERRAGMPSGDAR